MLDNYGFPYSPPYESQLLLMDKVYECLLKSQVAFFESPTGTVCFMANVRVKHCLFFAQHFIL